MKKTILITEDDLFTRRFLESYLKNSYNVAIQQDGLSALTWLQEGNMPDLILADINMPRLNGYEFLKQLRSNVYYKHLPIIILSGIESSKERIECLKMGANDVVLKPFNPEELQLKISNLLQLKSA